MCGKLRVRCWSLSGSRYNRSDVTGCIKLPAIPHQLLLMVHLQASLRNLVKLAHFREQLPSILQRRAEVLKQRRDKREKKKPRGAKNEISLSNPSEWRRFHANSWLKTYLKHMFAQRTARFTQVRDDCFITLLTKKEEMRFRGDQQTSYFKSFWCGFKIKKKWKEKVHLYRVLPKTNNFQIVFFFFIQDRTASHN